MLDVKLTGIKEIERLVYATEGCVSLSLGMMKAYGIPDPIKKHVQEMLATEQTDFYDNILYTLKVRSKISRNLKKRYLVDIPTEQIKLTHGCIGAISMALMTILETNDEVILPGPVYPLFENIIKTAKGIPVEISVFNGNEIDWNLVLERIKNVTTSRTKAILFSNPWNPLGVCVPREQLIELIKWCEVRNIYVIVDEVYEDFVYDEGSFHSVIPLMPYYTNIIRATSFSKNFGIGAWRIGYLVLPPQLQSIFDIVQHSMLVMPSQLGQIAAEYVLDHPEISEYFHDMMYNNLLMCEKSLQPMIDQGIIHYKRPQGTFFLFLRTNEQNTTGRCLDMINYAKVSLVPGDRFGISGDSYMRLCYGRDPETLEEGLKRFVGYWEKSEISKYAGSH